MGTGVHTTHKTRAVTRNSMGPTCVKPCVSVCRGIERNYITAESEKKYTTSGQLKMSNRIYGIKVSFWGSGTLKIVIPVENYPQKRSFRLADYHPFGWGC